MKVVILGVNGRLGLSLIKAFDAYDDVELLGVVRDKSRLSTQVQDKLTVVIEGDATDSETAAQVETHSPDYVLCAVGAAQTKAAQSVRADVTRAFLGTQGKFVAVSSFGVGDSMKQTNFALKLFLNVTLKHVINDHTEQEKLIKDTLPADRWLIVRPTALKDGKLREKYQVCRAPEKIRGASIGRDDVAHFIAKQVAGNGEDDKKYWGKAVTITW